MSSLFEDLLTSTAEDGASVTLGVMSPSGVTEREELMAAWLEERHAAIENRMFVDRAHRLLARILAEGQLTSETEHRARRLLTAIRVARRAEL